jgi:hypothetical protein
LKIAKVAQTVGLLFNVMFVLCTYAFGQKRSWATFWAILSQTHLVTLVELQFLARVRTLKNVSCQGLVWNTAQGSDI